MITVTVPIMRSFVPIVIVLFCTKLSRCFLYKFVPMNQSCSFFELLANQNSVAMKNGTVGRIGSTIPIVPSPRQRNPSTIQTIFNGFFIFLLFSCGSSLPFLFVILILFSYTASTNFRPSTLVTPSSMPYSSRMLSSVITSSGSPSTSTFPSFIPMTLSEYAIA